MELTHTRLLVNNYKECYDFYKNILGFECTWGDESSNYAQFRFGDTHLSIFEKRQMLAAINEETVVSSSNVNEVVLIFRVDDVDQAYEELKSKVSFITEPHDQKDWGIRVAHFRDPNGTLIEINTAI